MECVLAPLPPIECVYLFPATLATYSMSLCGEAKNEELAPALTPAGPRRIR
jgi:hypothetical protein